MRLESAILEKKNSMRFHNQIRRFYMATSEEVARFAGVSRATVSRALNGSARVSPEARERVHAAIAALGYQPDVVAQSLVRQRARVIAVNLFPEDDELPFTH